MRLWSCNIGLKNEDDICVLNKLVKDIDFRSLSASNDTKESLIKRIASSKYFNDIVIYNPTHSVLNENIQSHRPKKVLSWDQSSGTMQVMETVKANG